MPGELQPWFSGWLSPWSVDRFRQDIDELFDRFFGERGRFGLAGAPMAMWPPIESFTKDGDWMIRVDLPGVDPKDIDISVTGNMLTIRAARERRTEEYEHEFQHKEVSYGRFERTISLPEGVDASRVKANYRNGVLELTLPLPPEVAGRKIPIEVETEDKKRLEHKAA